MLRPASNYFLIKILRKEQAEKKGKIGSIIIPETCTFMEYNIQYGEVIGIGAKAHKHFPEVKTGHLLICHHFVCGESDDDARTDHLVHQDEDYNYYVVSCFDVPGKGNETYGVWDGEKIIPNKDYIFLEPDLPKADMTGFDDDETLSKITHVTAGGLIVFNEWKESREKKVEKMQALKNEVQHLSKSDPNKAHIRTGILQKEEELQKMSLDINEKRYAPYTIAAFNPELQDHFGKPLSIGQTIYCLNIACETHVEFMDKKYRVVKTNYIGVLA